MSTNQIIAYLAFWSFVGAVLFSIFVVFVFRSGVVYAAREADGTLKEKVPTRGKIVMAAFLITVLAYFVLANYISFNREQVSLTFGGLFLLNFALYLILFIYDTVVIDGFVLAYWRPDFLHLSEQMGRESMRTHIIKSLPVGIIFGLILAGLVTTISYFMFIK